MHDRLGVHNRLRLALAIAAVLALAPMPGQSTLGAATELLPDLRLGQPYNLAIKTTARGRHLLRFGTIVWNAGDGPFQVRAGKRSGKVMTSVYQWIKKSNGRGRAHRPSGARAFYSGDGHNHWHVASLVITSLRALHDPPAAEQSEERLLRKIGFCLVDLVRAPVGELRPPNSATRPRYGLAGCGNRRSTSLRMGISVGYGDDYKPFFTHQAIDITGLAAGTFRLCAVVNPAGMWLERADGTANNTYWLDVELDPPAGTLAVVAAGQTPCEEAPPEPPDPPETS